MKELKMQIWLFVYHCIGTCAILAARIFEHLVDYAFERYKDATKAWLLARLAREECELVSFEMDEMKDGQ